MLTAVDFTIGEIIIIPMDKWNCPLLDSDKFHQARATREDEFQIISVSPTGITVKIKDGSSWWLTLPFRPEEDVRYPRKKDTVPEKGDVKYERDVKHYSIHSLTDDILKMIDEEAQAHVRRITREWPFGHKLASKRSSTVVGNEVVTNIKWYFVEDKTFYHPKSI